jgi:uncharacterized protein
MPSREFIDETPGQPRVRGFLHTPDTPNTDGLVLTHGAGANSESKLLIALANAFCDAGLTVLRCDLPFRQARPHGPPPRGSAERDQQGLRRAVACLRSLSPGRIFLGGHSYGGRQASMLCADDPQLADALLLLSYPLHPPNNPEQLRTQHFPALRTPALFVSGERDTFATTQEMTDALKLIPARTQLISVTGAGHELLTKSHASTLPQTILEAFVQFANNSSY